MAHVVVEFMPYTVTGAALLRGKKWVEEVGAYYRGKLDERAEVIDMLRSNTFCIFEPNKMSHVIEKGLGLNFV